MPIRFRMRMTSPGKITLILIGKASNPKSVHVFFFLKTNNKPTINLSVPYYLTAIWVNPSHFQVHRSDISDITKQHKRVSAPISQSLCAHLRTLGQQYPLPETKLCPAGFQDWISGLPTIGCYWAPECDMFVRYLLV